MPPMMPSNYPGSIDFMLKTTKRAKTAYPGTTFFFNIRSPANKFSAGEIAPLRTGGLGDTVNMRVLFKNRVISAMVTFNGLEY